MERKKNKQTYHVHTQNKNNSLRDISEGGILITTHVTLLYYSTHSNEEPLGVATP